MNSIPVNDDAAVSTPPQFKKRGPKPSSKKRLEDFRYRKSYEAQSRIHREAFDDTNISLDSLLLALNDLHLGTTKQVAEVPITTRGIGYLTNECYHRAVNQTPRSKDACSIHSLYRVSLAQHQLQLSTSQEHHVLPDSTFHRVEVQDLSLNPTLSQEVKGMDINFAVTADLINATGAVDVHQQQFTPFVPEIRSESAQTMDVGTSTGKRRRTVDYTTTPDPYTVSFNNLRNTVSALSDPQTSLAARVYFKENNSIPGAVFEDNGLLLNPDEVMPANYDRIALRKDLRQAEAFFGQLGSKMTSLIGKCQFTGKGSPSQLCGYYKEKFSLIDDYVVTPEFARVRSARPLETSFLVRGALSLLGETPVDGLDRDYRQFAFREPINQVEYIDVDWSGLVTRCLIKR